VVHTVTSALYRALGSTCTVSTEQYFGSCPIISDTILAYIWRDWVKLWQPWVSIVGISAEIRTKDFPDRNLTSHRSGQLTRYGCFRFEILQLVFLLKDVSFSKTRVVHSWLVLLWSPSCAHLSKANMLVSYCPFTANTGAHGRPWMNISVFLTVHHPRKLFWNISRFWAFFRPIEEYTSLFQLSTYL
jgi:hypothetical protein